MLPPYQREVTSLDGDRQHSTALVGCDSELRYSILAGAARSEIDNGPGKPSNMSMPRNRPMPGPTKRPTEESTSALKPGRYTVSVELASWVTASVDAENALLPRP